MNKRAVVRIEAHSDFALWTIPYFAEFTVESAFAAKKLYYLRFRRVAVHPLEVFKGNSRRKRRAIFAWSTTKEGISGSKQENG
jgi:hypothetical protein